MKAHFLARLVIVVALVCAAAPARAHEQGSGGIRHVPGGSLGMTLKVWAHAQSPVGVYITPSQGAPIQLSGTASYRYEITQDTNYGALETYMMKGRYILALVDLMDEKYESAIVGPNVLTASGSKATSINYELYSTYLLVRAHTFLEYVEGPPNDPQFVMKAQIVDEHDVDVRDPDS